MDLAPRRPIGVLGAAALVATACLGGGATASVEGPADSVVARWNAALLEAVRTSDLGPPMVARALAVAHTCVFDAWAAYDADAVGTRTGGALRRPPRERTLARKQEAISAAAYHAAVDLFPGSRLDVFDPLMTELGHDPDDADRDVTSPTGVGNVACAAVLEFRHRDGANQLGDEPGGPAGVAYADYTGYSPVNRPMDLTGPFDPSTVVDPDRWQPLRYTDRSGATVTPGFVGAHWYRVVPFALPSPSAHRSPTGPARYGTDDHRRQALDLLDISARLTDEHKVIAEYWADGPASELPPGHWNLFAQEVARRDRHGSGEHSLDRDAALFFALNNAMLDASIAAWDAKRAFDSVRPITAVRHLFAGQPVLAWAGPYRGPMVIDGSEWLPYQPAAFPTPPFPEYASGHSTFSAAAAHVLRRASGSDRFGGSVTIPAGSSRVEPGTVPAEDLVLRWDTFTAAADQAGLSRRYGGIHFDQGDLDGRAVGRRCGEAAWRLTQDHLHGKRTAPTASAATPGASTGEDRT